MLISETIPTYLLRQSRNRSIIEGFSLMSNFF